MNSPCLGLTSVHLTEIISFSKSCINFKDIFTFLKVWKPHWWGSLDRHDHSPGPILPSHKIFLAVGKRHECLACGPVHSAAYTMPMSYSRASECERQSKPFCHFILEVLCLCMLLLYSICLETSHKSSPYLWEGRLYNSWNASVQQSLGIILEVAFHKNIFEMLSKYIKWTRLHNFFVVKFLCSVLTSKQYTQWLVLITDKSQQAIFLIW